MISRKERFHMIVTVAEFQKDFNKYLDLIATEDVYITSNGKTIAKVVKPKSSAVDALRGMLADIPDNVDMDAIREERLSKYETP